MYKLLIIKPAQKDIRALPESEISSVISKINELKDNPRPINFKKLKGSKNHYRLRKGDYRILYTIDDQNQEITIFKVRHRREAYR